MGYRNYLYKIKKEDLVEDKSRWDYDEEIQEIYEFGKYVDAELRDGLITIKDMDDEDCEFQIIDIESLVPIITHYASKFSTFLESLKDNTNDVYNHQTYIEEQITRWSKPDTYIYNLNKNKENLVNSWEYQYEIFDLIRIYKTFDTEKYHLLWLGH